MSEYSTFLFAKPSAVEGVARLIDVGGFLTEFNNSLTAEQADSIALAMDWKAVGADLWYAISKAEQELQGSNDAIQLSFLSNAS